MAAKSKEVAPVETALPILSEEMPDWMAKGNAGNEEVGTEDRVIPRIDIVQAISPQIKKNDPKFIDGIQQGELFNTVTSESYGSEAIIVPVYFRKEWTLWKLRSQGGGFFGAFPTESDGIKELRSKDAPNQYELLETHQHFVLVLADDGIKEGVISCTKSKLKFSRNLNTLVQVAGVDRFAKAYKLGTAEAKSDKGEYWAFKVQPAGFVPKATYDVAKEIYGLIKSGAVDVDRSTDDDSGDHATGNTYESAEL